MDEQWLDEYGAASFRLPGVRGEGLFLRSSVFLGTDQQGIEEPVLGVDVGLLTVQRYVVHLQREAEPGFGLRLSAFFLAAAADEQPAPFVDEVIGLTCSVVDSGPTEVEFEVSIDDDRLLLRTTRTAAAQAALDVVVLDDVDRTGDLDPRGW